MVSWIVNDPAAVGVTLTVEALPAPGNRRAGGAGIGDRPLVGGDASPPAARIELDASETGWPAVGVAVLSVMRAWAPRAASAAA